VVLRGIPEEVNSDLVYMQQRYYDPDHRASTRERGKGYAIDRASFSDGCVAII